MADYNRLPANWRRSAVTLATASEAVRNGVLASHPDWAVVYTTFLGDALTADWAAEKKNGTSATATVAGSSLVLTCGTDNDGYSGQGYGLFWKGDDGIYFESEQQTGVSITTSKIEVGLVNSITAAGAVNVKASPTGTADNFAVLVFDTDDNTQFDLISEIDNGGPTADAEDVFTLVAATNFTTAFTAQNDVVGVKIGSTYSNMLDVAAGGSIQGGTLMTPWHFQQNRLVTNANWVMSVNYMICAGPTA